MLLDAAGVEFESALGFAGLHQIRQPLLAGLDRLTDPYRVEHLVARVHRARSSVR
ncbi:hypothetical protein [Streptomyces sp. NBC_01262]|uniref:hypothetical protein n=1 Tax=Streptomyces sp. NBC_01262 TaxID=2903803 RepID=UPI002E354D53|nr:hypothetical protein [Streptomyces sp. NBC_01262]